MFQNIFNCIAQENFFNDDYKQIANNYEKILKEQFLFEDADFERIFNDICDLLIAFKIKNKETTFEDQDISNMLHDAYLVGIFKISNILEQTYKNMDYLDAGKHKQNRDLNFQIIDAVCSKLVLNNMEFKYAYFQ